ncbi:MAG TPA: dihydrolipoamide acetyltransferase family protein [Armatimonadota bacterium]|nr:dihydrolipoamide acetyltransferase family protein [Armatimonadota bacterium]
MSNPMREAIARHMLFSKQHIPHYYLTMRAEMSATMDRREAWNAGRSKEQQVSVNDLVIKAVCMALAAHPEFNGYFPEEGFTHVDQINIGVAIALPDGLIAPAILDCGHLSLDEIAQKSRDLAARTRQKTLKAEEYTSATFTVTNLGMYHVENFIAIIVPPQVGILSVGELLEVPAIRDGEIYTEHRMALTLSGDHRATDGAEGARFLGDIVSCLQNPEKLFT